MGKRNFNGTTFTLGGTTQGSITGISVSKGGAKIDVYEPGDLVRLFELGIPVQSIAMNLRGMRQQPTVGATGAPLLTLADTTTVTLLGSVWQCMSTNISGREDGAWEGSAEYSPTPTST